jgi:hypothetical protein
MSAIKVEENVFDVEENITGVNEHSSHLFIKPAIISLKKLLESK